jgi:hypothetical protein
MPELPSGFGTRGRLSPVFQLAFGGELGKCGHTLHQGGELSTGISFVPHKTSSQVESQSLLLLRRNDLHTNSPPPLRDPEPARPRLRHLRPHLCDISPDSNARDSLRNRAFALKFRLLSINSTAETFVTGRLSRNPTRQNRAGLGEEVPNFSPGGKTSHAGIGRTDTLLRPVPEFHQFIRGLVSLSLSFAAKHSSWTSFPSSVTLDCFQRMGWPQMTHFIGGSSFCLGEETSSGMGEDLPFDERLSCEHFKAFIPPSDRYPFLFAFCNP